MARQLMTIFVCVVALAAIVAGCGSDSDAEDVPTPTKAAFTKKASAICLKGVEDVQRGLEKMLVDRKKQENFGAGKDVATELAVAIVIPDFEEQVEELRALGAPKGDEETVTAMLDAFDTAIEEGKEDPKGLFRERAKELATVRAMATKYGIEWCGQI